MVTWKPCQLLPTPITKGLWLVDQQESKALLFSPPTQLPFGTSPTLPFKVIFGACFNKFHFNREIEGEEEGPYHGISMGSAPDR